MKAEELIVIVGSAHLDIIADYGRKETKKIDKIGQLKFSVGGTSFNIATILAKDGRNVALLTGLNPKSFSSKWILDKFKENNIQDNLVYSDESLKESGFIALRKDGKLVTAVTSSNITDITLPLVKLEKKIKKSIAVVVDCNLSTFQLDQVISIANRNNVFIFVAGVSDSKISRIKAINQDRVINVISMNEGEAKKLISSSLNILKITGPSSKKICGELLAEMIVITRGEKGCSILSRDGLTKHFPAPEVEGIKSTTGSGDALLAGIVSYYCERGKRLAPTPTIYWGISDRIFDDHYSCNLYQLKCCRDSFCHALIPYIVSRGASRLPLYCN